MLSQDMPTVAAIATPPGQGGIAVVRLSGPQAIPLAARVFRPADPQKSLAALPGYSALFGHFYAAGRRCDQTVALVFRAPKSYTGEDVVELSCHGGTAVVQQLLDACLAAGAAPAPAGEFTRRAFLNGKLSLTQAEAVMDLVAAENTQAAAAAAAAMQGALWREVEAITQQLLALGSHIAAWCDYPEEDVPALQPDALRTTLQTLIDRLQTLLRSYDQGELVCRGAPTAIVGAPNVGKSTLLNLLTGQDTAIVTPIPGTTRDVVEQTVRLGQLTLRLADTAGLRPTADAVEQEGIRRSCARLQAAALVLAVFDTSRPFTPAEQALARALAGAQDAGSSAAPAPVELAAGPESAPTPSAEGGRCAEENAGFAVPAATIAAVPSASAPQNTPLPSAEDGEGADPLAAMGLTGAVTPKPTLFLFNKADLPAVFGPRQLLGPAAAAAHCLCLCAADPACRPQLEQAVLRCLDLQHFDPDAPLLANRRQWDCTRRALAALQDAAAAAPLGLDAAGVCIQDALAALYELTGENAADALIDEVFSRFCVGK